MSFGPARHELQEASWRGGQSGLPLAAAIAGVLVGLGALVASAVWQTPSEHDAQRDHVLVDNGVQPPGGVRP